MECRNQRCALAANGYVTAPEIGDRRDAGLLGDDVRIGQLHGERYGAARRMVNGLAVTADGADSGGGGARRSD